MRRRRRGGEEEEDADSQQQQHTENKVSFYDALQGLEGARK
jgi:hypothetical protein